MLSLDILVFFDQVHLVGGGGGEVPPYNMVPFGIGRRACAGTALAKRVMGHALGALVQSFEWDRIGDEEIDMTDRGNRNNGVQT